MLPLNSNVLVNVSKSGVYRAECAECCYHALFYLVNNDYRSNEFD